MKHFCCILIPCITLLVAPTHVNASFYESSKKTIQKSKRNKYQTKSRQNNYSGVGIEIGASLEHKKMSTDSRDFKDSPTSISVMRYGGNMSLGYSKRFCRDFYVGIFAGIDASEGRNKMWIGGKLSPNSEIVRQNLVKRDLLRNLLGTISSRMSVTTPSASEGYISEVEFYQLTNYIHYIGGTSLTPPELPYSISKESAVFDRIRNYGISNSDSSDQLSVGLGYLGTFASEHFPDVYRILGNMASNGVYSGDGNSCLIDEMGSRRLSQYGAEVISELFRGDPSNENGYHRCLLLTHASQILPLGLLPDDPKCTDPDLTSDQKQLSTALRAIDDMYYNDDALLAPPGVDADALKNKFHTTTSFDVCPHISLQLGYYFKELNGMMYTKIGAMELNGRATIVCDTDNVYTEKFKKWAPFVAVGFNKNLTENFGFAFELAQTFKAKEKLPTIRLFNRYKIDESVTLSRTIFRATLTYRLPHSRN